jgi:glycosyltransferase involved in cell wall biosynthesis
MPVYNEAEGIADFIFEINRFLFKHNPIFLIVDDKSTDLTFHEIQSIRRETKINILPIKNKENIGHGPSTIKAITEGLKLAETIITVDGDGQFYGSDIYKGLDLFLSSKCDVLEAVRVGRSDPWFRKVMSFSLKYFILLKSGKSSSDANTPLRFYKSEALEDLLRNIPKNTLIPNLYISVFARRNSLIIESMNVRSRDRRGNVTIGSTWGRGNSLLPNLRLIKFSLNALRESLKI